VKCCMQLLQVSLFAELFGEMLRAAVGGAVE